MTVAVRNLIRGVVEGPGPDRHLAPEIDAVVDLLESGQVSATVVTALQNRLRTDLAEEFR